MRRLRTPALFAAILSLVLFGFAASSSRPALAVGSQIRTFVASTGSDANPCSRVAPCRTFGAALAQTAGGGEIVALDSGGYGAVTISQSVTIVAAPGVQASISPSSGSAIVVNAAPSDTVILRNLNLNGQGGLYGVHYQAGGALHIEALSINGFGNYGIQASLSSAGMLYVADTVSRNNGGGGIYLHSTSGTLNASVVRVRLEANAYNGLAAGDNTRVTVKDSVASGNLIGFAVLTDSTPAVLNLEGCVASGNTSGIYAYGFSGTATVRVSNCTVTDNTSHGVLADTNGTILSRGNNTVEGNNTNGSFSGSFAAK